MGSSIKYVRAKGEGVLPRTYVYCLNLGILLSKSVQGGGGRGWSIKIYVSERAYFMDDLYRYKDHIFLKKSVIAFCRFTHMS